MSRVRYISPFLEVMMIYPYIYIIILHLVQQWCQVVCVTVQHTYIYIYTKIPPIPKSKIMVNIPNTKLLSIPARVDVTFARFSCAWSWQASPANWWELVFQIQGDFVETRYFMVTTLLYQLFPFFEANSQGFFWKKIAAASGSVTTHILHCR